MPDDERAADGTASEPAQSQREWLRLSEQAERISALERDLAEQRQKLEEQSERLNRQNEQIPGLPATPRTTNRPRQSGSRRRRISLMLDRMLNVEVGEVHNTQSIHIWAITVCLNAGVGRTQALLAALFSLALVTLQGTVLYWVVLEASAPTCATHTECRVGEFCMARGLGGRPDLGGEHHRPTYHNPFPRCYDCQIVLTGSGIGTTTSEATNVEEWWSTACAASLGSSSVAGEDFIPWGDVKPWDDIDHTKEWLADPDHPLRRFHPNGSIVLSVDEWNAEVLAMRCREYLHCAESDMWLNSCDHIKLNMANFHPAQRVLAVFMSLLFAEPLARDVYDASIEEAVLNHHVNAGTAPRRTLTYALVRRGLRMRRIGLPFSAASAAAAILLGDALSSTNILLNLIAVAFILDADDMVSSLFLPPSTLLSTDALVRGVELPAGDSSWLAARILGLWCAFLLVIMLQFTETGLYFTVNIMATVSHEVAPCFMIQIAIVFLLFAFGPPVWILGRWVTRIYFADPKGSRVVRSGMSGLVEDVNDYVTCLGLFAFFGFLAWTISDAVTYLLIGLGGALLCGLIIPAVLRWCDTCERRSPAAPSSSAE